ncbi:hypothetical protein DYB35_013179 [Aphanomyces astaci]|uniref:DDE Tnp4 domain-containing protein n=1 Tax=Aphanomyces astaci TaxID=112090 RepID=A0A3R7APB9_APHAT|nr:hypothetical protein DYB35_013179 [Aphanomyces astaci]
MVFNPSSMLASLVEQSVRDQIFLNECLDRFGPAAEELAEAPDSMQPIMDKTLQDAGPEGFRVMTNFTPAEFDVLWGIIELPMQARWNEGRGAKTKTSARNAVCIALAVLKHYQSWEKHALDFGFKAPTFQKLVQRTLGVIGRTLCRHFIRMPSMTDLRERGRQFTNYPYALYATDVIFQPCERPGGRFNEKKA